MNYRHIFHAGNICDVIKHAVLSLLLERLREKDKGFCVIDTHAGAGLYDLHDPRAAKTNEAQNGIYKLLATKPLAELSVYYSVLQKLNLKWNSGHPETLTHFHFYAGSPLLTYHQLRPQDRLIACELHKDDAKELRHVLPLAEIHHRDGYEALHALLPPPEKRGLVLIDPPYEKPDEYTQLLKATKEAYQRWPTGIFLLWYPIKERPQIWQFHEDLVSSGIPKQLCAEFIYQDETRHDRLNGSGLILINPPWQTDEKLRALFPQLHKALQTPHHQSEVKWLTSETLGH